MKYGRGTSYALFLLFMLLGSLDVFSQVAVKTNLLYDATTTPNLGVELGIRSKNTVQVYYGLNPWKFESSSHPDRRAKHWLVMPEYRRWTCTKFNGFFYGVHAMGGQFNASDVSLPFPGAFFGGDNLRSELRGHSYEGGFAGCGFTCGYQWILSRHFNIEAEAGVGYDRVWYDKYQCGTCGPGQGKGHTNYAGLTKVGIALLYIF